MYWEIEKTQRSQSKRIPTFIIPTLITWFEARIESRMSKLSKSGRVGDLASILKNALFSHWCFFFLIWLFIAFFVLIANKFLSFHHMLKIVKIIGYLILDKSEQKKNYNNNNVEKSTETVTKHKVWVIKLPSKHMLQTRKYWLRPASLLIVTNHI